MPAVACYLRRPGETQYRAFAVDVLEIEHGRVAQITAFDLELLVEDFGIPRAL